ncbi:hypothetical protein A1O3_09149 [Capronia epimyces CBS 606.96]|uniref:CCHC-type domain-containing protein n=1 Tax=Capronia epimyces CBS 606.96 TaxID=1182542 RepID=W9XKZ0_9EURO|nr:uncharacterized protein A1O3_09149 [Capronia epimyces CBS 606.96]EXJ77990.1 hypothetical protein A1O3_09149 [Capronia epimyces CBS 606.96]
MPRSAHYDEESESRTASVGARRSQSHHQGQVNSLPHSPITSQSSSDNGVMGNTTSRPAQPPTSQNPETSATATASQDDAAEPIMNSTSHGLGNNRLATGFRRPRTPRSGDNGTPSSTRDGPSESAPSPGGFLDDAIEISSDEDQSSDGGGMVINLDNSVHPDAMVLSDEEGEVSSSEDEAVESHLHPGDPIQPSSSVGHDAHQLANSTGHVRRLADLTPQELEQQLKYALFDLDPDQIDLGRSAVCLGCLQEGHSEESCPEKICLHCASVGEHSSRLCPQVRRCFKCRERGHATESCSADLKVTTVPCDLCGALGHHEEACSQRFFPFETSPGTDSLKLWVSCCVCASKSHLVGDCPDADRATTVRWSLRSFTPSHITNLSLEAGTKQREKQAASRGLRPDGLRIRGRAGFHAAGFAGSAQPSDDDSDEEFLGPRVPHRENASRGNFSFRHSQRLPGRDDRYGRYEPANDRRGFQNRPPTNWYATDSFGRGRPRSPPSAGGENGEHWNRGDDSRRRSRSPRGFDGYRPRQRRSPSPRYHNAPPGSRGGKSGQPNQPQPGMTIQLPVRRGSNNPSYQGSSSHNSQASAPRPQQLKKTSGQAKVDSSKKKKYKKGKANT